MITYSKYFQQKLKSHALILIFTNFAKTENIWEAILYRIYVAYPPSLSKI